MSAPIAHREQRTLKTAGVAVSCVLATTFGFVAAQHVDSSRLVQRNKPWVEAWTQELSRPTALPEFASATERSNSKSDLSNPQTQSSSSHSSSY
ncbi:MAG TPA: hypothetical protein VGP63_09125 [Planctomycetaceae bacterium]|jgi:hypothetical protein|nr:hypothetical protein [Planctomycetaceae bacterium]